MNPSKSAQPPSSLVLSVGDLLAGGSPRRLSGAFGLGNLSAGQANVKDDKVEIDLSLEGRGGQIVVSGVLRAVWVLACRRCLEALDNPVDGQIRETYEEKPVEGETFRLDAGVIDLLPMLQEAILLELPLAPLCAADCSGPACGEYWGGASGDLPELSKRDERWAALDALRSADLVD